jgi:hypothetical protein
VSRPEKHVSQTLEVASIAGGLLFGQLGTKGVASNAGGLLFAQLGTKGVVSTAAGFFARLGIILLKIYVSQNFFNYV